MRAAPSSRSLSYYDGRRLLARLRFDDGIPASGAACMAVLADGRELGRFPTVRAALAAVNTAFPITEPADARR